MGSSIVINIEPNTKPRMTRRDKWAKRPCVLKYWAFCDELRKQAEFAKFEIGHKVKLVFYLPMPDSWSKRKKVVFDSTAHQSTPDIDNLVKAVFDGLLEQDKMIYSLEASKWWSTEGKIIIQNL